MTAMVAEGYDSLRPLLEFRNWLAEVRDRPAFRCRRRRNGGPGPGPITLEGRKVILRKLRRAEALAGRELVTADEVREIRRLWRTDLLDPRYQE